MAASKLYYTHYYPGLVSQELFCENYPNNHSGNLPIADSYANPMTMRLIAIQHVLAEMDKLLHPDFITYIPTPPYNPTEPYKYSTSSAYESGSSKIISQVDFPGIFSASAIPSIVPWKVDQFSGFFSITSTEETLLYDFHVLLYSFLLNAETALDRIIKEVLVCYNAGAFTDRVYFSSFFDSRNNHYRATLLTYYSSSNIFIDLGNKTTDHIKYNTWLRNMYAHQGYVHISINPTTKFLELPIPTGTFTSITDVGIYNVCTSIFKDLLSLIDTIYQTMYRELC